MKYRYLVILFFNLLFYSSVVLGQPGAPPPPPGGGGDDPVVGGSEEVPLDGATLWLLLAGSALFYKRMFKKSKENQL